MTEYLLHSGSVVKAGESNKTTQSLSGATQLTTFLRVPGALHSSSLIITTLPGMQALVFLKRNKA
jgi:hypothetical protein